MALIWMIAVAGILSILQGWIIGPRSLRRIQYERKLSHANCHAGDQIEMVETISNNKRLPVPWLRLESDFPASFTFLGKPANRIDGGVMFQNHISAFALLPKMKITRRHFITCKGRGIYRFSTVKMMAGDIFGMFQSFDQIEVNIPLVVYPKLLDGRQMPYAWEAWQGEYEVRRWILEDPFLIEGAREYAPGDPMNRIHWKATARTGKLEVYQQGYSADPKVMILLNMEASENDPLDPLNVPLMEHAISIAATCASELVAKRISVGFGHNGHTASEPIVDPDHGNAHLMLLMESMAGIRMKSRMKFEDLLHEESARLQYEKWDYLIISVYESNAIQEGIALMREHGHHVSIINPQGDLAADDRKVAL